MSTPVLDVRDLAFAYPDGHQALFGVDLHVHRGERVALLGPNGAGKTTTLRCVLGLLTPTRGTATIGGLQIFDEPAMALDLDRGWIGCASADFRRRAGIHDVLIANDDDAVNAMQAFLDGGKDINKR